MIAVPSQNCKQEPKFGHLGSGKKFRVAWKAKKKITGLGCGEDYNSQKALE